MTTLLCLLYCEPTGAGGALETGPVFPVKEYMSQLFLAHRYVNLFLYTFLSTCTPVAPLSVATPQQSKIHDP